MMISKEPLRDSVAVELRDVVLAAGRTGEEDVLLRGANFDVRAGEHLLVSGLDDRRRSLMAGALTGSVRPRYGDIRISSCTGVAVLDAGDSPTKERLAQLLAGRGGATVVLLTDHPVGRASVTRHVVVSGGHFLTVTPPSTPTAVLIARVREAVTGTGADPEIADLVARALVDAERRGHPSHGVALLPTYLARAAAGGIDPLARPRLTEVTKGVAVIDAGGGYGQSAADLAAQWCAERARDVGVAAVAVRDNNHVGMLAAYRWPFQRSGTVGLLLNISGPSVAPPNGLRPTLGSNAVCMVVPLGDDPHSEPFCVDFATGVVAAGKVRDAANRGESIPDHWLIDKYGRPTTDPAALDNDGAVPLFGDYKGLCVTLIAEMLGGAMAGGVVSPSVGKQRAHPEAPMRCSQLFVAFSLQHFGRTDVIAPLQQLREAVAAAYDTPPLRPWFPDQAEADHAERTDTTGIHLPDAVIQQLGWEGPDR